MEHDVNKGSSKDDFVNVASCGPQLASAIDKTLGGHFLLLK